MQIGVIVVEGLGAKNAVRKNGFNRPSLECSNNAAPSDRATDNGTPTTTKYSVLPRVFQNNGLRSRPR